MDVLSDVLSTVRLESRVFAQTRLAPPWGIRAEAAPHIAFHVVTLGGDGGRSTGSHPPR